MFADFRIYHRCIVYVLCMQGSQYIIILCSRNKKETDAFHVMYLVIINNFVVFFAVSSHSLNHSPAFSFVWSGIKHFLTTTSPPEAPAGACVKLYFVSQAKLF